MVRSELKYCLGDKFSSWQAEDVSYATTLIFDIMSQTLVEGGRIELRGFGIFDGNKREARIARNPKNGSAVAVPAKNVPYFRMGKGMKDRLNK